MGSPDLRNRLLAVLAADATGYSRLMSLDARATVAALDGARDVFREHVAAHDGRVVDMAGDSVLAVFETAAGAVQAALDVQRQLEASGATLPETSRMRFRVGIHVGDVIVKPDGSVYGDGVNIAARLQTLAPPGAVAVSQSVHGMVVGRVAATFEDIGERAVKNIARPVRVYRVAAPSPAGHWEQAAPAAAGHDGEPDGAMFGRAELLAELATLVAREDVRLLTLTGPGGSGKTRLALRVNSELAPTFADGACVVLLAPVRDPEHVMAAIAAALGLQEGGAEPLDQLVLGYLRQRHLLLTLDNFEHLPQAAAQVAGLLRACPRLKVLATSRVRLHLDREREVKVPPLALPETEDTAQLMTSPALALFAARALTFGRDVMASAEDLRAAAQICRRLDGLPLAIELAVPRLRALTPTALAARLQQSLPLLKSGNVDMPDRQRTLRDTIAWSHDLLPAPARILFRRLGVFAGGWSLDVAEVLAGDDDALDAIELLMDHNLVLRSGDVQGQPRYSMLETIREFALERLDAAGEATSAREQHADFYVALAVRSAPHLVSAGRLPWLHTLRAEMSNFRLALAWLVHERRDAHRAGALCAALTWLWYFEGLYREGSGWMREALTLPGAADASPEAAALWSGMARLASFGGDMAEAHRLGTEAAARWRALDDPRGLGFALFNLGVPTLFRAGREEAAATLREARRCFEHCDDAWGQALATVYEGVVLAILPGAEDAALALLEEGYARCVALGDDWAASTCSGYIGSVALRRGDRATARRNFDHILGQARRTADRFRIARAAHFLAELELLEARHAEALDLLAEAMRLTAEQGRLSELPQLLRTIARTLVGLGRHEDAARLFGAGARSVAGARSTLPPDDPAAVAAATDACRQAVGDTAFDRGWQQGSAWAPEHAVDEALGLARKIKLGPA